MGWSWTDHREGDPEVRVEGQIGESAGVSLGVDLGTCWSRLVRRNPGGESQILAGRGGLSRWQGHLHPSRVTLHRGRLWTGWAAEARRCGVKARSFSSLKGRWLAPEAFFGPFTALPEGLGPPALLLWHLVDLFQTGLKAHLPVDAIALGAPGPLGAQGSEADGIAELGLQALYLAREVDPDLSQGLALDDARHLLSVARGAIEGGWEPEILLEVYSERLANLIWVLASPFVAPGTYGILDVGAAFNGATLARVLGSLKGGDRRVEIYGDAWGLLGGDAMDAVFAEAAGRSDLSELRGEEPTLIARHKAQCWEGLVEVYDRILAQYKQAYEQARSHLDWGDMGLLLFGGGSWIRTFRERALNRPDPAMEGDPSLIASGQPVELLGPKGRRFRGEPDALASAYGLAALA